MDARACLIFFNFFFFLSNATTHLFKRPSPTISLSVRPFVLPSVRPSVRPSVVLKIEKKRRRRRDRREVEAQEGEEGRRREGEWVKE